MVGGRGVCLCDLGDDQVLVAVGRWGDPLLVGQGGVPGFP